ncbi:MAG: protein kinase [Anaerolineae bacterium]|nr:protein kinase [Anaerolineae bacterium]
MATVYKGYDRELDRHCAIKVLPPQPDRDPIYIRRFRREALAIARLQHPHILALYDSGSEDDIFYLVTPYVEGGSLADLIHQGTLPIFRVAQLLGQLAAALDYAHSKGVIHRDIKPANVLLNGEGDTFLADFGIAKLQEANATATKTGHVIGTPTYMSPEQGKGKAVDSRADIYSLGVVIYELLTGQPPFISDTPLNIIFQHATRAIPNITKARSDLPPALNAVMDRVLAKEPKHRFQSALEFSDAFMRANRSELPDSELSAIAKDIDSKPSETPITLQFVPSESTRVFPDPPTFATRGSKVYTFLFADIEDSGQLWEQQPEAMTIALDHYEVVVSDTVEIYQGKIFITGAESMYAVFDTAENALEAALAIQRALYNASTRPEMPLLALSVQMGIYSGEAEKRGNEFFGIALNRAARFMKAARGGQILISEATKKLLPDALELRDLGRHRLREINETVHIFQAVSEKFPLNAAPVHSLTPRPTNLPAQITSLIGREQHVAEIGRLMRQPNVRLLSLLGPGGIGKTRLSIEVGASLLDEYEDGIYFIPLAPLNHMDAILKNLVQALDIVEDGKKPLLDLIKAYLQSRQLLLIFDNFEHMLDAAPVVNELLTAAARVKVLATSREPLFIYGERNYVVSPLALPDPHADLDELRRSPAVALFVDRVQAVQPEFALTAGNAPNVTQICRQLDGLPLALELASARVRDLALSEIADQLTKRLALLSKGPRDLPLRQQTMRGAIDWSYHLLNAEEQRSFAQLAIFENQFLAEAAIAITATSDLESLKNKSLLQQPAKDVFSMLTVLREYAHEKLDSIGETEPTQQKHTRYYCQWLEKAEPHLNGRDQIAWFGYMKVERYNLEAALARLLQQNMVEDAGRMVGILWRYWATQSLLSEGAAWIDRVFTHADQLSTHVHAKAAQGAGRLAMLRSNYERATTFLKTSLSLFRSVHDQVGEAVILQSLGETELLLGSDAEAEPYLEAGLNLNRALANEAGIGRCLNLMGQIILKKGDFARAEAVLHESLTLARTHGSSEAVALALYELGGVLRAQAKNAEAEPFYRESLTLMQELDLSVGVATMLYNLGFTRQAQGDHVSAFQNFQASLKLLQPLDELDAIAACLIGVAGVFMNRQQFDLATKTLGASRAILEALDADGQLTEADQTEYDRVHAALQVYEPQWAKFWQLGLSTPTEQIIREVLREA